MSEMKNLSVDEILDDIKQKKSGSHADSSASSVDVDRLVAEIMGERKALQPADAEQPAVESVQPLVKASDPAEAPQRPQREKFTVKIQFDEEPAPPQKEEEPPRKAEGSVSTVDLLAESIACPESGCAQTGTGANCPDHSRSAGCTGF